MKITRDQFNQLFSQLRDNFKGLESISRLQRCYNYVSDLPVDAVRTIVDDMVDNERFAPLPVDFEKKASAWKKDFFFKNGYYFGEDGIQTKEEKPDCDFCMDTGIVKITHHDTSDKFKQLMRCACVKGDKCIDNLPQWSQDLTGAFIREKISAEWFNPKIEALEDVKLQHSKIWAKLKEWQDVKMKSVKYWFDLGFGK